MTAPTRWTLAPGVWLPDTGTSEMGIGIPTSKNLGATPRVLCKIESHEQRPNKEPVFVTHGGDVDSFLTDGCHRCNSQSGCRRCTLVRLAKRSEEHTSELQSRQY